MPTSWFHRMGDIPGLDYEPPEPVDRESLDGHNATPTVRRNEALSEMYGKPSESLTWTYPGQEFGGSASPAHQIAFQQIDPEATSAEILERLWQTLELPGEPIDYHFALQSAASALWNWQRRRREPELVEWVERLSLINLRLLQAHPEAVWFERPGGKGQYVSVLAFGHLHQIYEAEGFLEDALLVAKQAAKFDQMEDAPAQLETRLSALRAEDEH